MPRSLSLVSTGSLTACNSRCTPDLRAESPAARTSAWFFTSNIHLRVCSLTWTPHIERPPVRSFILFILNIHIQHPLHSLHPQLLNSSSLSLFLFRFFSLQSTHTHSTSANFAPPNVEKGPAAPTKLGHNWHYPVPSINLYIKPYFYFLTRHFIFVTICRIFAFTC